MGDSKTSRLPWDACTFAVGDANGVVVAECFGEPAAEANAELIVRAVNAHDELIAALRLFHPNNATELYERAAADFYKAYRLMAPGKSVPLEMAHDSEQEARRQELWRPFVARWREQFIDAVLGKAEGR